MKTSHQIVLTIVCLLWALAPPALGQTKQPVDYVDPHIGSISYLLQSVPPTVQLPFGMIRLAPLTSPGISDSYLAEKIYGFPVEGAVLMPTTGPVETDRAKNASLYDHDFETSTPYYYAVTLEKTGTQVEFTVTERATHFRFAFPKTSERHVVVHLTGEGTLSADPAHAAISGFEEKRGTRHYFYAESSRPFTVWGAWEGSKVSPGLITETGTDIGMAVTFPGSNAELGRMARGHFLHQRRAGAPECGGANSRLELCRGQEPGARCVESGPGKNCGERRE